MTHTPGPWKVFGFDVQGPNHETVAECKPGGGSLSVKLVGANAHLIAAAPDMEIEIAQLKAEKTGLLNALDAITTLADSSGDDLIEGIARKAAAKARL